jgi:hypothetical protein
MSYNAPFNLKIMGGQCRIHAGLGNLNGRRLTTIDVVFSEIYVQNEEQCRQFVQAWDVSTITKMR